MNRKEELKHITESLKSIDYIEQEFIYNQKWLCYRLYTCNNYRIHLNNGIVIIITEKDNFTTGKPQYTFQVYIETGHIVYQLANMTLDKKRLNFITIEDYLKKLFMGGNTDGYGEFKK